MRDDYYSAFEEMNKSYGRSLFGQLLRLRSEAPAIKRLSKLIDDAAMRLEPGMQLRPDARYFLLMNIHQMILIPLRQKGAKSVAYDVLPEDITLIVVDAARAAREADRNEVTGGGIVRALARVWDKLRVNALEVWA